MFELTTNPGQSDNQIDSLLEDAWQSRELFPGNSLAILRNLTAAPYLSNVQKAKTSVVESFHHGREFRFKSAADSALNALDSLAHPADDLWLARLHGRLGIGLHSLGDLATAYLEFQKQVEIAESGESSLFREELFLGYHNLGRHFYRIKELAWAEHYFDKCNLLTDESDFQMGFLLLNHAHCHFAQSQYHAAFVKAKKAMEIGSRLKVDRVRVYTLPILAKLSAKEGKHTETEQYLLEGCRVATAANLPQIQIQLPLVEYYLDTQQYKRAAKLLKEIKNPKDVIDLSELYLLKSRFFELTGKLNKALAYHKLYFNLQEQIISLKKQDQAHASSVLQRINLLEKDYNKVREKNAKLTKSMRFMSQAQRHMKTLAERDPLTNLYNRRQFMILANTSLRIAKEAESSLTLAIVDIDEFKDINDSFGHLVGDSVLTAIASLSDEILRGNDAIGRFGGDEFVIMMSNTELDASSTAMQRFKQCFKEYNWDALSAGLNVTFSCGIAQSQGDMSFSDLLALADKRLYLAKNSGRNKIVDS